MSETISTTLGVMVAVEKLMTHAYTPRMAAAEFKITPDQARALMRDLPRYEKPPKILGLWVEKKLFKAAYKKWRNQKGKRGKK